MAYRARPPRPITIEKFEQIDEPGFRVELSNGMLVREPIAGHTHGRLAARIGYYLSAFVMRSGIGEVFGAETGFILASKTVRGPDAAFVANSRIPADLSPKGYFPLPPDFAVEVVSPSNTAAEVQAKIVDYLQSGVKAVWVVYPGTRTVAVHLSLAEAKFYRDGDVLTGEAAVPGFELPVTDIFGA
jgi:Uma2 family endonuclease